MVSRLQSVGCWFALTVSAAAMDVDQITPNSGVTAVRSSAEQTWTILRSGDDLPAVGEFRASPGRPARWTIAGGTIQLAAESKGRWDAGERRLSLQAGQAFVQLDENAEPLRLTTGDPNHGWKLAASSQVVLQLTETQTLHVIQGQATPLSEENRQLTGPITLVRAADGTETTSPPENAEAWADQLLRWTKSAQGLGQLIAKDAQDGSPVRLEIARYRTNVVIQPPVALVQIDQSFYNPYGSQQEGTFVFNLPPGASVSRFAMFVTPEQLIEGELIDRREADRIYTSIVRRKRDPAILEQIGDNLFRMRVFPIFARDTKRILLDFTVPLAGDGGEHRFELPLLSDLKPIWDFSLRGTIYPPADPQQVKSYTHPQLKFERLDDGRVVFSQVEQMVRPAHSLQISYPVAAERPASVRAYSAGESLLQYFLATIPAGDNPARPGPHEPADVLVVMDTSGSMGNLSRSRAAVRTVINQLRPDDRVQLGCVDVDFRPLTNAWLAPGDAALKEAYQQLQQQVALGASELNLSLDRAAAQLMSSDSPRRKLLVYIGDGAETKQQAQPFWTRLAEQAPEKRPLVCMVRISRKQGDDGWMRGAIRSLGGRYFDLDFAPNGIEELFEWCLAGMPVSRQRVQVEAPGVRPSDLFVPPDWPAGRDLHVLGRRNPSDRLTLKVSLFGHESRIYELAIPPASQDDAVFTGRLWAQRKLEASLQEHQRLSGSNRGIAHDQIVALCQEWSLMSPMTAFLVLESEEDYGRWNINRRLRQRYWSPPEALPFVRPPEGVTLAPPPIARQSPPQWQNPSSQNRQENSAQAAAWDRNFVRESLERAQQSLQAEDFITAYLHLARARDRALKFDPDAFQELYRQVSARMERESSLERLGLGRALADRQMPAFWSGSPPFLPLLVHAGIDPDYVQRNPHALKLSRPIKVPKRAMVRDFAKALQEQLGIPVLVAEQEIIADGGSIEQIVYTEGLEEVSAANLIRHALEPLELDLVVDRHIFRITTSNKSCERMQTKMYPVGDLLRTDILPPPMRLSNPLLDREELARRRIEARLRQPITVNWENVSFRKALDEFSELAGVELRIKDDEIRADGGSTDQKATLQLKEIPADIVLRELLEPMELASVIHCELLTVTTMSKAYERMETRLYSAAGLVDGLTPEPVRNPKDPANWYGMGMGGGFGGMGMGGMGGGFFGGMGGMGGGMMGGMGGAYVNAPVAGALGGVPSSLDAGLSETEPPPEDPEGESLSDEPTLGTGTEAETWPSFAVGNSGPLGVGPAMNLLQQNTSGEWESDEGVGGAMSWYPNTLSLVVTQPPNIHEEIRDMLRQMRQMADRDPAHKLRRPRLRRVGAEEAPRSYGPLMMALQQHTSGEWESMEGVGGQLTAHFAGLSLMVRQSNRVHDEIEDLLARLRRARYLAETIPTRDTLDGIDDEMFFFDHPVLTRLPRDEVVPVIAAADREAALTLLSVRKNPPGLRQQWRRTIPGASVGDFSVRRFENRLEIETADRRLRAEGLQAAVGFPRLGIIEIDTWGEAMRQLVDGLLPWLPHRDNEELVQLFEVTSAGETDDVVTLRLTFRRSREVQIEATFAKADGGPTAWIVRNGQDELFHLQLAENSVAAVDPQGQELERWELAVDEPAQPIAALDDFGQRRVVVRVADEQDGLAVARAALRANDYAAAVAAFRKLKQQQPDQPLINFLLAWSLELSHRLSASDQAEQRAALVKVVQSDAADLLPWLNPAFFPSLGSAGLLQLLLEIPAQERSLVACDQIAELAMTSRREREALPAIARALELDPNGPQVSPRRLRQIECLLRLHDAAAAQQVAQPARDAATSTTAHCEIADLFYRYDQPELAAVWYQQALAEENLPDDERAQLLARQALWLTGESRWRKLFEAQQFVSDKSRDGELYLSTLLQEVASPAQAKFLMQLADAAQKPRPRRGLLVRAAEITDDPQLAAKLAYDLFQERELPRGRMPWMISKLLDAGRGKDVVPLLELRLRQGDPLDKTLLNYLANGYRQLGRLVDAQRASTQQLDVPVPDAAFNHQGGSGGGFF